MRNKSKLPKLSTALEKLYVGANRCASCHVGEFDQWKATRHATAMKTLVEAGKQNDSQCQKCHTTAFGVKGGFTDLLVTPNLAGIQCESCHGPGGRHIEEEKRIAALAEAERVSAARKESMIMNRDAKFCMECHDAKNDPDFDFARDMKFIDHTTTPPARMKKTSEALKLHSGER